MALTTLPLKAGWLSPKKVTSLPSRSYPVKKASSASAGAGASAIEPSGETVARWGRKNRRFSSIGKVPGNSFS